MPDIDFDKIALSKDEQDALNELSTSNLLFDGEGKEALNRLVHYGLADKVGASLNQKLCFIVKINDTGKDYLAYSKMATEESRKNRLHDWHIAIFSTLGGALLSKPIWEGIDRAWGFIQPALARLLQLLLQSQ